MNLRPAKAKVIFSILIPLISWIIVYFVKFSNAPQIIQDFLNLHDLVNLFSKGNIILFVIEFVIIYLILSVFHRRRQHWNQPIKPL
jgi:hypothetical protein